MSVRRSASGEGSRPRRSSSESTKASIPFRIQRVYAGGSFPESGRSDHQSAPAGGPPSPAYAPAEYRKAVPRKTAANGKDLRPGSRMPPSMHPPQPPRNDLAFAESSWNIPPVAHSSMDGLEGDMYRFTRFLLPGISVAAALLCAPSGRAADCNANGEDDAAEIAAGRATDCNLNGVPDTCDVVPSRPGLGVRTRFALDEAVNAMAVGDLDGNDMPDVITAAQITGGGLDIHFQDPPGAFERHEPLSAESDVITDIETADLDGDGDLDIAAAALITRDVAVLLNDGAGSFGKPERIGADLPVDLLARDLDGDGRTDLAFASPVARMVGVLWNDGSGGFGALIIPD